MISNSVIKNCQTLLLQDAEFKHAVIKKNGIDFFVIDLLSSSGTYIKINAERIFEQLEPLKLYNLNYNDCLRFGTTIVKFVEFTDEIVEASQTQLKESYRTNISINLKPKLFVPCTEFLDYGCKEVDRNLDTSSATSIPETQYTNDDKSNDSFIIMSNEKCLYSDYHNFDIDSQNVFADVANTEKICYQDDDDDDDMLDNLEIKVCKPQGTDAQRQGSVTPDIEMNQEDIKTPDPDIIPKVEPNSFEKVDQWQIATQLLPVRKEKNGHDIFFKGKILQSETCHLNDDEDSNISDKLKIKVCKSKRTNAQRRHGSVTSEIGINRDDTKTPDADISIKKEPHLFEKVDQWQIPTQILPISHIEKERQLKQIHMSRQKSSDEKREQENSFYVEPEGKFFQATQPIFAVRRTRSRAKIELKSKPKTVPLDAFFNDTIQQSPKSKIIYNMETQPVVTLQRLHENYTQCSQESQSPIGLKRNHKRPRSNRILVSSSSEDDDTQHPAVKVSVTNAISPFRRTVAEAPITPDTDDSIQMSQNTPVIPHRILRSSQLERVLETNNQEKESDDASDAISGDSDEEEMKEESSKPLTLKPKIQNERVRRMRKKLMKYRNDTESDESLVAPSPEKISTSKQQIVQTQKKRFILISNIPDESRGAIEKSITSLNGEVTDSVLKSDFLVTSANLKFTAKVLSSICKGIPIVCEEYINASISAKQWMDPNDFIIKDICCEKKKKFVLKDFLQKAKKQKLFGDTSVYITKHCIIPQNDLKEILICAGADVVDNEAPKYQRVMLVYNPKDKAEVKKIKQKHPCGISSIRDIHLTDLILKQ